ncbi:MAG TPA: signal peptidase I [Candidatus Atribacteria bacterium]|nr:signal peptidase I [Candidatus Atribacteria bacterium]
MREIPSHTDYDRYRTGSMAPKAYVSPTGKRYDPNRKKRSALRTTRNMAGGLLVAAFTVVTVVMLFFILMASKSDAAPVILGHRAYIVRSGSMSPSINVGSLILVRNVKPEAIAVNDIITYMREGGSSATTHRVVGIENDGGLKFITKGDANIINDPVPVESSALLGKVVLSVPYLGYVIGFAGTKLGTMLVLVIPGVIIMIRQIALLVEYSRKREHAH